MSRQNFQLHRRLGRQQGVALAIALIALVAMTLAGLALIRSVDTTNVIAGNLAFRQATLQATDVGVETAFATVGTIAAASPDTVYPSGCGNGACNYYPTRQTAFDAAGVPTVINWSLVPATVVDSAYSVQYVIERLCDGPTPVTDIAAKCMNVAGISSGSHKSGAIVFTAANQIYYRTFVRVSGPRNTVSVVQTTIAN